MFAVEQWEQLQYSYSGPGCSVVCSSCSKHVKQHRYGCRINNVTGIHNLETFVNSLPRHPGLSASMLTSLFCSTAELFLHSITGHYPAQLLLVLTPAAAIHQLMICFQSLFISNLCSCFPTSGPCSTQCSTKGQ